MKLLKITFLFLLGYTSVLFSQEYADKIEAVLDNPSAIGRGKITEDNGTYSLFYFDKYEKDSHVKALQEKGFHGGGPTWLALVYAAFNIYEENLIDSIQTDVEVSGVSFKSNVKDDIEMIAKIIGLIKKDEDVMNALIEESKKLDIMK